MKIKKEGKALLASLDRDVAKRQYVKAQRVVNDYMTDFKTRKNTEKASTKALLKAAKLQESIDADEAEEKKANDIKKAEKKAAAVKQMMKAAKDEVEDVVKSAKTPKMEDMQDPDPNCSSSESDEDAEPALSPEE